MFTVLSFLCYAFAVVDLVLFYVFDTDITGLAISPIIAGGLGALFSALASKSKKNEEKE